MADSKITGLGALTAGQVADATDLLVLVDVSDTTMFATGTNKKVTRDALIPELDVTAGTVAASKAVVVDASKDASAFRTVGVVNLDAGSSGVVGSIDVFPTTASKGKMVLACTDQTGDTAVTINANVMGQATVVNIPDPGAAASYVAQSTAALSLLEMDVLDGAGTGGTPVASKVQVADANQNIGTTKVTGLHIGTSGSETEVTATAAELNYTDVTTIGTTQASKAVVLSANKGQDVLTLANAASAASTIATDHTAITAVDDGSSVHLMATKDDNGTETVVKLAEQSSITNLSSRGATYSFDGVNDITTVTDNANLDFGTGDFSLCFKIKTSNTSSAPWIINKWTAGNIGYGVGVTVAGMVRLNIGDAGGITTYGTLFNIGDGESHTVAIAFDRDGNGTIFGDGKLIQSISISSRNGDISNGEPLYFGTFRNVSSFLSGELSDVYFFNCAITDADERAQIALGNIPAKYQWGSQTALYTSDFSSGLDSWVLTSGDETSTLTFVTDHGVLAVTAAGTNASRPRINRLISFLQKKKYKLEFGYTVNSGTCILKQVVFESDAPILENITLTGTGTLIYEYAPGSSGGSLYFYFNGTNEFNLSLSSVTLTQLGAVAAYSNEGIGHYSLMDNSSNALHGIVNGATPLNLNIGAKQTAYLSTTSTTPTMTDVIPGGWKVNSISIETAQNLTVISATQETSSIALIAGKTLNNGKMVWSTMADHMLYASGTPKDIVFALTGNGGVGAKIYVELVRVF